MKKSRVAAIWISVFLVLTSASLIEAVKLTQSNDAREREIVTVVYAPEGKIGAAPLNPPVLRFGARDASELELRLQPTDVPTTLIFAVSDVARCQKTYENEGSLLPLGADLVQPNRSSGHAFDPVHAFAITTKLRDVSISCTLNTGAARLAFSTRRFALAGSARFVNVRADDGCVRPTARNYCPVTTYRLEFDGIPNLNDLRTEGGREIAGSPEARLLVDSSALVHVRWRNEADDHWREFLLFVVAGVFALGLAAALEAIKAVIDAAGSSRLDKTPRRDPAGPEPDATPAGLKKVECPPLTTPRSSSSAPDPPA